MKIGIVGSRGFSELEKVRLFVGGLVLGVEDVVVSGGAGGVDRVVEEEVVKLWGKEKMVVLKYKSGFGRSGGFVRNDELVRLCDKVVVFWDGVSSGSKNVIELCKKYYVKCEVVLEENGQLGLWG